MAGRRKPGSFDAAVRAVAAKIDVLDRECCCNHFPHAVPCPRLVRGWDGNGRSAGAPLPCGCRGTVRNDSKAVAPPSPRPAGASYR